MSTERAPSTLRGRLVRDSRKLPSGFGPSIWSDRANRLFFLVIAHRMPQRQGFDRLLIFERHIERGGR